MESEIIAVDVFEKYHLPNPPWHTGEILLEDGIRILHIHRKGKSFITTANINNIFPQPVLVLNPHPKPGRWV